jgi:hypothetical protein
MVESVSGQGSIPEGEGSGASAVEPVEVTVELDAPAAPVVPVVPVADDSSVVDRTGSETVVEVIEVEAVEVVKENFFRRNFDLSDPETKPFLVAATAANMFALFSLVVWAFLPSILFGFIGGILGAIAFTGHKEQPRGLAVMNIVFGGVLSLFPLILGFFIVVVLGMLVSSGMVG